MTKYYTIEEAAEKSGKSTRTVRRYINKLDKNSYDNQVKFVNNKLYVNDIFIDSMTGQKRNVKLKNVKVKTADSDDLKRQILNIEKKLDEKESEITEIENTYIAKIETLTSKVIYLDERRVIYLETQLTESKDKIKKIESELTEAKTELDKIESAKTELMIQKAKLEEQLTNEKEKFKLQLSAESTKLQAEQSKTKTAYLIAGLMFLFVMVLFVLIAMQVF